MTKRWYFWCPKCKLTEHWSYNEEKDDDIPHYPTVGCNCNEPQVLWKILRHFKPDLPEHPIPGVHYDIRNINIPFNEHTTKILLDVELDDYFE